MGPSLYPRGQTIIGTMEAPRLTPDKEGKDRSISLEGYSLGFLGCRWYSADRLSPKRTTINGSYYASRLTQSREKIKIKRRGKPTKGVLFHQDNAPIHKSVIAMAAIHDCGFKLIENHLIHLIWFHQTFIFFQN